MQMTKECIHTDFKTHGQSHTKSETEGTSGPSKFTLVQQKFQKQKNLTALVSDKKQSLWIPNSNSMQKAQFSLQQYEAISKWAFLFTQSFLYN